jgi:hypothetical protein
MISWKLQEVPIKDLKEHPKNPRQIDKDKTQHLTDLIAKFGLIDKPILNADFMIIGGHQRIKILKKQKVKTVECWVCEQQLSDAEIDELCIGLNLHQGKFDYDVLANLWDPLDLLNYGFSEEQLMGTFDTAEKDKEEKKNSSKKEKECPNCGHQF